VIPKIILGSGPRATHRTIGYLFGPGRANEHTDPHLVASWNDFAPDPGRTPHRDRKAVEDQLARQLDQPVNMLGDKAPKHTVWHCPVRAAPEDPVLTDTQWAAIARRIVAAAGIAPEGDEDACRWVAVRHAEDHIHIAATLVRQDGRRPRRDYDKGAVQAEARRIEADYGLRRLRLGDGTAAKRPSSKEHFKAKRLGQDTTAREVLRLRVRRAVAAATDEADFFALLEATDVIVRPKTGPSGQALGYTVALPGDTNQHGEPVLYSGSTLAPDLSLPKIRTRLGTNTPPTPIPLGNPWHQATAATDLATHRVLQDDATAQGQVVALGMALDLLPTTAPPAARAELRKAATAFERATRSRVAADLRSTHTLRRSIHTIWREHPADHDGTGFTMLIDALLTAIALAAHWHRTHQHAQQEAAARQAFTHLQTAYAHTSPPVLAALAQHAPALPTKSRYAHHLRQAAPEHAERILTDPAWDALTTVLAQAEAAGHNATTLLDQSLRQCSLDDAHNPARALTWRIRRLSDRHAPSPRATAAKARIAAKLPTGPSASKALSAVAQPPRHRHR
jgi:hypothetical protein